MKKITLYGTMLCQDTIYAIMKLKEAGVTVEFHNMMNDFADLRTFMTLREDDPVYAGLGKDVIGIPLFIFEDGSKTLSLTEALAHFQA